MINVAQNSRENQEHRLKLKTLSQQMQNVAVVSWVCHATIEKRMFLGV
jgi:hypothetical protein